MTVFVAKVQKALQNEPIFFSGFQTNQSAICSSSSLLWYYLYTRIVEIHQLISQQLRIQLSYLISLYFSDNTALDNVQQRFSVYLWSLPVPWGLADYGYLQFPHIWSSQSILFFRQVFKSFFCQQFTHSRFLGYALLSSVPLVYNMSLECASYPSSISSFYKIFSCRFLIISIFFIFSRDSSLFFHSVHVILSILLQNHNSAVSSLFFIGEQIAHQSLPIGEPILHKIPVVFPSFLIDFSCFFLILCLAF